MMPEKNYTTPTKNADCPQIASDHPNLLQRRQRKQHSHSTQHPLSSLHIAANDGPDRGAELPRTVGSGKRVLVIAPSEEGEALACALSSFGHTPVTASSLAQGLAWLTLSPPDLMILDIGLAEDPAMPTGDWKLLALQRLPVVFITPGGFDPLEAREIAAIGNGLLLRPWHRGQLGAVVEMTLAGARWNHAPNRSLFDAIPEALLLVEPKDDVILDANAAACALFGLDCTTLLSHNTAHLLLPAAMVRDSGEQYRAISVIKRPGDQDRGIPVEITQRPLVLKGRHVVLFIIRDTWEKLPDQDEDRLLSQAVEQSPCAVVITDTCGRIQYANQRFTALTGYSSPEAVGQNISVLHSGFHQEEFFTALWQSLSQRGHWQGEICNRTKDGEIYWEYTSVSGISDARGDTKQYIFITSDITQRKIDEDRLRFQAMYDALTELPNRRLFIERLQMAFLRCQRHQTIISVLYLDLDEFKIVNDTFGHHFGDKLLQEVGRRLKRCLRANDTVARIGGDEFALLLHDLHTPACAHAIVAKIRLSLEEPCQILDQTIHIKASMGLSCYPGDGEGIDDLIKKADDRMYLSKRNALKNNTSPSFVCVLPDFSSIPEKPQQQPPQQTVSLFAPPNNDGA